MRQRYSTKHMHQAHGFTMIEMIVVTVAFAVLATTATKFIANPTNSFFDTQARGELSDRIDGTLRKVSRQIRNALPNSLRVSAGANSTNDNSFLEFVPIKEGGRYRASIGTGGLGNALSFNLPLGIGMIDILGPAINIDTGDQLVIYNLGEPDSDVYESSAGNLKLLTSIGSLINTLIYIGGSFSLDSPAHRFYIIRSPVSYACDMTTDPNNKKLLMYTSYSLLSAQPTSIATLDALSGVRKSIVAEHLTSCHFTYDAGLSQRLAVVNITIGMESDGAQAKLMHQININNSP